MKKHLFAFSVGILTFLNTINSQVAVVTSFAGSGVAGSAEGTGSAASFDYPYGMCTDASGNVYVADGFNNKIRKITPAGVVSTFAGTGSIGAADGASVTASFSLPTDVCMDGSGNLYVADYNNNSIRKITTTGVVSTFASGIYNPYGICIDASDNIYVTTGLSNINKITPLGAVTTLAGGGVQGDVNGNGTAARFSSPIGICVDVSGNIYVVDQGNHKIKKITQAGDVTTFVGSGTSGFANGLGAAAMFNYPGDISIDASGDFFVTDNNNYLIRKITPAGDVTTFAGSGTSAIVNGIGTSASFRNPVAIFASTSGIIYVSDQINPVIRKITPCVLPIAPTNTTSLANAQVCAGNNTSLTVVGTGTVSWFASSTSTTAITTGSVIVTSNTLTVGSYSYYAEDNTCASSASRTAVTFTVNALPTVSVSSGAICSGTSYTMIPSGADTYTYSGGSSVVSPTTATSSYSVVGTSSLGCVSSNTAVSTITVNALPTVSVSSGVICAGTSYTMIPGGADTYTYSNGTNIVAPTTNTSYTVTGRDANGCDNIAVSSLTVNSLPNVMVTSSNALLCIGQTATLTASGATSYTWNTTATTTVIAVSPTVTTSYNVVGADANDCFFTATITQNVSSCTSIDNVTFSALLSVYPNPSKGMYNVNITTTTKVRVLDVLGKIVYSQTLEFGTHQIDLSAYANGLYLVKAESNGALNTIKLIKD